MSRKLSFAGVSLPLATPALEEAWLAKVHPRDVFRDFDGWNFDSPNSISDPLPTPPIPVAPAFKFGVLQWPVGASRPAWFHAVVNRDILNSIRTAVGDPGTPQSLTLYDGRTDKTVTASMYMLPARPLNQLGHTKSDGWMLTLTDQRFFWCWRRGVITDPTDSSWAALYQQIATILGVTITVDTVNSAYATPSKKWASYYGPTPAILDAIASTVGQRIVVSLSGSVSTTNPGTASTASGTYIGVSDPVISGGYLSPQDIGRYVPASVKTLFLDASTVPYPAAPVVVTNTLVSLSITDYGTATGLSNFSHTINGDLPYDGTNQTALNDYGAQAATDWYNWRLVDTDIVWPGIEPYPMTGWEDCVEWTFQKRTDAPFASTYVRRGPFNDMTSGDWKAGEETEPPVPPETGCGQGCGWFAGLASSTCLGARVIGSWGSCDYISSVQNPPTFGLRYATGEGKWVSQEWSEAASGFIDRNFQYGLGAGPLRVWMDNTAGDQPNIAASINDLDLVRECCGSFTANFTGGNNGIGPFCSGTPIEGCNLNIFTVEVYCQCCFIDGWEGDGWYCIVNFDEVCGVDTPTCVYLRESSGDACNTSIIICDGPFESQEECEAACTGTVTIPCTDAPLSAVMNVLSGAGPCATSLDGLIPTITGPTGSPPTYIYTLSFEDANIGTLDYFLTCNGDVWTASVPPFVICQPSSPNPVVTVQDATHLRITHTLGGAFCGGCDNESVNIEIIVTMG